MTSAHGESPNGDSHNHVNTDHNGSAHDLNNVQDGQAMSASKTPPKGIKWRSSTAFILTTATMGMISDMFIYGIIVPIMPFILLERVHVPESDLQKHVSSMLAVFAGASVTVSPIAGWLSDKCSSRQLPFLIGLVFLILATALMLLGTSLPVLYIARLLQGASSAVVWTAGLALVIDTVGSENLGTTMGTISSFLTVGELSAPVLGGVLYAKGGLVAVGILCVGILIIDIAFRLLLVEKRTAARYIPAKPPSPTPSEVDEPDPQEAPPSESTSLLPPTSSPSDSDPDASYLITTPQPRIIKAIPILYCLRSPALLAGLFVSFIQAFLLGTWDATIPLQARSLFALGPLDSGLLFAPIISVNFLIGPLAGYATDRLGTKAVAVTGFALLVPALTLLRIPVPEPRGKNIAAYCVILALCGVAQCIACASGIVEAGLVVQRFHKANPGFFGETGPYASLYGINSLFFSAGLAVGPLVSGGLRERVGYGNMGAVLAGLAGVTGVVCFVWMGSLPGLLSGRKTRA